MGNAAYDARRDAERAEAVKQKASAQAAGAAFDALTAFMRGTATLQVTPPGPASLDRAWTIRLVSDPG